MTTTDKEKEIAQLIEDADRKIENLFHSPEDIKEYLNFKAKFYNYSILNSMLIQKQFPGAEFVGSYTFFNRHGFHIKKGEKGITVRALIQYDYYKNAAGQVKKLNEATPADVAQIRAGELQKFSRSFVKFETVFDISQTNATVADLPKLAPNRWLEGTVESYERFLEGCRRIAEKQGTTILAAPPTELGSAKGITYAQSNAIALNPRNSELQNIKTLIHELLHARLHTGENIGIHTRNAREMQAEMTAYVVCQHYGIDTSDYSFSYIRAWTEGITIENKKELLNQVSTIAKDFINSIDAVFYEYQRLPNAEQKQHIFNELKKGKIKAMPKLVNSIHLINLQHGKELSLKELQKLNTKDYPAELKDSVKHIQKALSHTLVR